MTAKVIRILFITRERFPTHRVDVEVLFARELVSRGHAIDFVMQAAHEGISIGLQRWHGRAVWIGPTDTADGLPHRFRKHWLGLWHDVRSLRLAQRACYDAVQVKDKFLVACLAQLLARLRGLKFFFWLSFPVPEAQRLRARDRTARYPFLALIRGVITGCLLYRWILPRSDHVFVQSQQMKEDICAHGVDPTKVTPVPMGVDLADFPPPRPNIRHHPASQIALAYLGSLASERRLEVLVDMLSYLRGWGLNVSLALIGDGDTPNDRRRIEHRARELGVSDWLMITGFLPRPRALEHVRTADLCLSPFYPTPILWSTSPTKLAEYLALGLPVVANNHPEQRLVLRESRAGVCVPWGARHFARAVKWLMTRSEAERLEMGARGRSWVATYRTYDRIAEQVERTYLDMLPGSDSRRSRGSEDTVSTN